MQLSNSTNYLEKYQRTLLLEKNLIRIPTDTLSSTVPSGILVFVSFLCDFLLKISYQIVDETSFTFTITQSGLGRLLFIYLLIYLLSKSYSIRFFIYIYSESFFSITTYA